MFVLFLLAQAWLAVPCRKVMLSAVLAFFFSKTITRNYRISHSTLRQESFTDFNVGVGSAFYTQPLNLLKLRPQKLLLFVVLSGLAFTG